MNPESIGDLGIIMELKDGLAIGTILGTDEPFKVKVRPEAVKSLELYVIVLLTLDHTDFIYQE
ncbi:hypothetical protein [Limosilactobacillus fermentum]|uniref:Uncharacterized protein n=1 Tax=Limosilactobacillus fermentum TaxID=1613 RepID=A0A4Z0CFE3_LIMFE|nr:hypothetical protein [Limosilactobacillus fermentum]KAB1958798.1 hypothetical protein F8252_07670 [Limosilactobacillus fermentum]MCH5383230.1 hypothetical protein [Limosilactobacillus fermentum]MCH5388190.1 hypothetical protein [Limosilactobacillus fermentum]MCT3449715.1 hypothetical protein [Limosilactobacillus fermentum]MCT3453968.1 hypothetical protein [Limosilactobacillus fermentum]